MPEPFRAALDRDNKAVVWLNLPILYEVLDPLKIEQFWPLEPALAGRSAVITARVGESLKFEANLICAVGREDESVESAKAAFAMFRGAAENQLGRFRKPDPLETMLFEHIVEAFKNANVRRVGGSVIAESELKPGDGLIDSIPNAVGRKPAQQTPNP